VRVVENPEEIVAAIPRPFALVADPVNYIERRMKTRLNRHGTWQRTMSSNRNQERAKGKLDLVPVDEDTKTSRRTAWGKKAPDVQAIAVVDAPLAVDDSQRAGALLGGVLAANYECEVKTVN